jgi:hypothetical protein
MSTFLIEKDTPGLSFGHPEDKMGLTSTSSREIFFSDCRVPARNLIGDEGEGTEIIGKAVVGWGFFGAGAISVGIAKSATALSVGHAKERTIAGQPIAVHQAVQFLISDMILGSEKRQRHSSLPVPPRRTLPQIRLFSTGSRRSSLHPRWRWTLPIRQYKSSGAKDIPGTTLLSVFSVTLGA